MDDENSLLARVAAEVGVRAREFLLTDSDTLRRRNEQTREFIERFRIPNPLRTRYAEKMRSRLLDGEPDGALLSDEDRAALSGLRFHPVGVYRHDDLDVEFERWIGPDGAIVFEGSAERRFLVAVFDDDVKIAMHPDLLPLYSKLQPDNIFVEASGDLVDDYGRMLELVARRMLQTGATPLYRFEDAELDRQLEDYNLRHQVPLRFVAFHHGSDVVKWAGEKVAGLAEGMTEAAREQGQKKMEELGFRASVTEEGIVYDCQQCEASNHVPFEEVDRVGECTNCEGPIEVTGFPCDVVSAAAFDAAVREIEIPILVDFWAAWCGPCVAGMPAVIEAAEKSESNFIILRVDGDELTEILMAHSVMAFPTMVRFHAGDETSREVGMKSTAEILKLSAGPG